MTENTVMGNLLSRQLDEYRLEALLGQGGMACVYRGFDVNLKRHVAIKVIGTPFRGDTNYIKRFEREAQAIAQLKHPHIVGLYRYGKVDDDLLYIAMEYIEGADLDAVLVNYRDIGNALPPKETVRIIRQICLALDYAHSRGVIHRDVKPSNIMVNKQGNAILTDFGLVLFEDQRTQGEIFGTPHYIAPEQAISSAGAVPQSDLYSVGVILYQMFTAQLPFEATHPYDLAMLHLSEPPPLPAKINPAISPQLETVILTALAKEPEERYSTGEELADALAEALQIVPEKAVVALPPPDSHPSFPKQVVMELAMPSNSLGEQLLPPIPAAVEHPSDQGGGVPHRYILKNIRALLVELTEQFSETELRQLCFDIPDFSPVHRQLGQSDGKVRIIDRLLEYAEQTLQVDALLLLAKEHNPAVYQKHKPYYKLVSAGRETLLGQMLGKYHVVERLGRGGMADVYKAFQSGLSRFVAIKMIHSHLVDNEEFVERFEHEALAVARLRHPNIVQVFDFDRDDDRYYMVMEFIEGSTLRAELDARKKNKTTFSLSETVDVFNALIDAISYAHSQGIIHRDLKPGNIMFTPDRRVVLTDFGIARIMSNPSYTVTNAIVGTPAYMSPEQAQSQPVDERTDIYSLGVILYEMVTGRAPFSGDRPITIILKLVSGSLPLPTTINPNLPAAVERVILKAMSRDAADRYLTANEMAQALQNAVNAVTENDDQTMISRQMNLLPAKREDKFAAIDRLDEEKSLQKSHTPEITIPGAESAPGGVINISNSGGQVVFGGEHAIQFGDISGGQVNIGVSGAAAPQIQKETEPVRQTRLQQMLGNLKTQIQAEASPKKKDAALERVIELEEAITAATPDMDTMAYVKRWFAKNLPALAKDVARLIIDPSVGELMEIAGARFANEYFRRFGPFE